MRQAAAALTGWLVTLLTMLLVAGGGLLITLGTMTSPAGYLSRHTGYTFLWQVRELHSHDAVGHGRDYNSLRVFSVGADAAGLEAHLQGTADWQPLPLPEELTGLTLLDPAFDEAIRPMLDARTGYYRIDYFLNDMCCGVYVYDAEARRIYIRTTSYAFSPLPRGWIREE